MEDKIDGQKIFSKNNYVSIFINLKFFSCLIIMSVTNQNISDLIASLVSFFIDKKNPTIKISKRQFNHTELLLGEQLLNRDVYTLITTVTKKRQRIFGVFSIVAKLFESITR